MMNSVIITPVRASAVSSVTAVGHQSSDNTQSTCYSCVDDHRIPPCAGFSQDYSCLPNLGSDRQA
ncbi:hypothetical protein [cyanobacterium endosymbiont of Epithemia clementina EcSB]|uniref:hypothetical protein n=1 Tax=cyanobacterium endosymbiont of Epithemia clementina EcSB TaxID=3034674 RepID=UPI002480D2AE|nr:hypothetical protein [cyanobacterium endosymbiont of Epithemia clementina EcSB]WGT67068.1 hypothetical protein P3F56_07495 [cyanobacterium endosymbiont of Epithemia clementina EcSB]